MSVVSRKSSFVNRESMVMLAGVHATACHVRFIVHGVKKKGEHTFAFSR
jgi:hypothetical protein